MEDDESHSLREKGTQITGKRGRFLKKGSREKTIKSTPRRDDLSQ